MKPFYSLILMLTCNVVQSCPLCVAKVRPESPPFFSDTFYQPTKPEKQIVYLDENRIKKETTVSGFKDNESIPKSIRKSAISG